jgi:hypothetical protein
MTCSAGNALEVGNLDDFRIGQITESDLEAVAAFLDSATSWRQDASEFASAEMTPPPSLSERLGTLRWRLLDNPARTLGDALGQALRGGDGDLAGVNLAFPGWFVRGDRRLRGLGSGNFYVVPRARMHGFFLFRRFLKTSGVDFFFATTCNSASAPLWEQLGGRPVPGARETCSVVLWAAPIAEEYLLRMRAPGAAATMARAAGRLITPALALIRRGPKLSFRPCDDWDRLAALATLNRDPAVLCADRTADFLRWRHERSPGSGRNEVLAFDDSAGRAGWVVVRPLPDSGTRGQIRNMTVLDACCPGDGFDPADLVRALARRYSDRVDQLYLSHDLASRSRLGPPLLWRRSPAVPTSYLISRNEGKRSLADAADFSLADGDQFD